MRVRAEVRSVLKTDPHAPVNNKPLNPIRSCQMIPLQRQRLRFSFAGLRYSL